jgi:hypothetical protein
MTTWHGYPQAEGAHPERPWWRRVGAVTWQRTDGLPGVFTEEPPPGFTITPEERAALRGFTDPYNGDQQRAAEDATLAILDRAHPLPAPPPRVGQVWVWAEGIPGAPITSPQEAMVGAVSRPAFEDGPLVDWCGGYVAIDRRAPWPPAGAVLVAGAGAPWAPERG